MPGSEGDSGGNEAGAGASPDVAAESTPAGSEYADFAHTPTSRRTAVPMDLQAAIAARRGDGTLCALPGKNIDRVRKSLSSPSHPQKPHSDSDAGSRGLRFPQFFPSSVQAVDGSR